MTKYVNPPGKGAVFPNTKTQGEGVPDYVGFFVTPDGAKLSVGMWRKTSLKTGREFFSLGVREWKERPATDDTEKSGAAGPIRFGS